MKPGLMNLLNGKKVLVTGAGGFIGSHLCSKLIELGADVTAMLHYNSTSSLSNLEFLSKIELEKIRIIKGNIEDPFFVNKNFAGFDIVFHLAALIGIPYSYVSPINYIRTNVEGTINVCEASRNNNFRLIHTSTSETYGTAKYEPINEEHPLQGQSPYSASKIAADKVVESYVSSFSINAITIRPFNVYGPRQSARAIIPTIISQMLFNNKIEVGNVEPVRDFTFVNDTVNGFLMAGISDTVGKTINLGSGKSISILELIKLCQSKLNKVNIPIESSPNRIRPENSEVYKLVCDNDLAKKTLGWKPDVAINEGIEETINFISKNQSFYKLDKYEI